MLQVLPPGGLRRDVLLLPVRAGAVLRHLAPAPQRQPPYQPYSRSTPRLCSLKHPALLRPFLQDVSCWASPVIALGKPDFGDRHCFYMNAPSCLRNAMLLWVARNPREEYAWRDEGC